MPIPQDLAKTPRDLARRAVHQPSAHADVLQPWTDPIDTAHSGTMGTAGRAQQTRWRNIARALLQAARAVWRRLQSGQPALQIQALLTATLSTWLLPVALDASQGAGPKVMLALRLSAASLMWRLSTRRMPNLGAAWAGLVSAGGLTLYAGAQLNLSPMPWAQSLDIMSQMALVGWWCACLWEGRGAHNPHPSLQPRPGRRLGS